MSNKQKNFKPKPDKTKLKLNKTKLKLDKAEDKLEKAHDKIPKKKGKKRLYEKEKPKDKLDFTEKKGKPVILLVEKPKPSSKLATTIKNAPTRALIGKLHSEIGKHEEDNVGVKSAYNALKFAEFTADKVKSANHSHKLKPYKNLEKAEKNKAKADINLTFQQKMAEHPTSNPISKWQQKRAIKKQYAKAHRTGTNTQKAVGAVKGVAIKGADTTVKAISAVIKNPKVLLVLACIAVVFILVSSLFSSCSVMLQGGISSIVGTSYTSEDENIVEVDNNYTELESQLQEQIDNIESDYHGYDEYRYYLDEIGHNPHELASYLTALYQTYKPREVERELQKVLELQYTLELDSEIEIRYREEERIGSYTTTDLEGNITTHYYTYTVHVPYDYHILNVTLTKQSIKEIVESELSAEQLERFHILLQSSGNKPLIFGGGSSNTDTSTDLSGVDFVDGERTGNQTIVDIAKSQVGNVGGQPYWSWYGFDSRVEWCATFVSWVLNQAGYSEPKFAACQNQGIPYFRGKGQWASRGFSDIAPGDIIFFDWQGDGHSDHVGIVIGTDGSRVYTVEGNSGNACKIRDYDLNSSVIMGYGLIN